MDVKGTMKRWLQLADQKGGLREADTLGEFKCPIWSSRYPDQMVDLHPGKTTTHLWMSAETMSARWQIPVKTSLMAPAQILSKDYENQTSSLHRPFLPASPTGMMFIQAEEVRWNILNGINQTCSQVSEVQVQVKSQVSSQIESRWRRGWQPCCELRENSAGFRMFFFFLLLFYVLDVVSITVYDRDTLLNIGSSVAQRKPDFEFLNAGGLFTDTASEPFVWNARSRRKKRSRKRGKRAGVLVRLRRRAFRPPLPTILLANVQSLDN